MSSAEPLPSTPPATPATASADSGNALPIGQRLHEFEITGLIGEGGFGIVYLALDTQLQRTVAIKEYMPASLAARGSDLTVTVRSERHRETFNLGMRSFVNEARLLASFDHPALIKVYRFWEDKGTAYMVMPYYQGPTLKAWLRQQPKPPDEAWLKALLAPLLDALQAIHADHCYHRDIAPDNILLLGPDKPLLLDFGAARRVIGDATQALTVILKPGYAPIEQYAEVPSMKQGPWTDVYALCAVLYAAITGKAPPPSVGRMVKDDMVPVSQAAAGRYSAPFLAAIDAGLVVHPDQRVPDIAALRERLFATALPSANAEQEQPFEEEDDERTRVMPPVSAHPHTGAAFAPTQLVPREAGHAAQRSEPAATPAVQPTGMPAPAPADDMTVAMASAPAAREAAPSSTGASVGQQAAPAKPQPKAQTPSGAPQPAKVGLWIGVGAIAIAGAVAAGWYVSRAPNKGATQAAAPAVGGATVEGAAAASMPSPTNTASAATASAPQAAGAMPASRDPFTIVGALEEIVRNADPLMAVNTITDKTKLVIGRDKLLFQVRSSVPGYLYVYLAGTDANHFYLLFPNAIDQNNHIDANKLIELPRKGWHITAGGPPGVDHIVTVVSPYPRDLDALPLNTKDAIPEFDMARSRQLWDAHTGQRSPFIGPARCDGGADANGCDQRYGASFIHIEEVEH